MFNIPDNNLRSWLFAKTKEQFTYRYDEKKKDKWKIYTGDGSFEGDCEDFSFTLCFRFFKAFWIPLFLGRFKIYFVKFNGEGHVMCCVGDYWYDNIMKNPTKAGDLPPNYTDFVHYNPFVVLVNYFIWKR